VYLDNYASKISNSWHFLETISLNYSSNCFAEKQMQLTYGTFLVLQKMTTMNRQYSMRFHPILQSYVIAYDQKNISLKKYLGKIFFPYVLYFTILSKGGYHPRCCEGRRAASTISSAIPLVINNRPECEMIKRYRR